MRPVPDARGISIASFAFCFAALTVLAMLAVATRSASAQIDTLPPTVEITEAPKSELRTHKIRKPVTFAFASDDPLASFTCRIDKSGYYPCSSPMPLFLMAGKGRGERHTFFVRSTDLAGNSAGVAVRSVRVQRLRPYR